MKSRRGTKGIGPRIVKTRAQSMNDIRARQNAESPLLRLPLELKTKIYEYVCGGQTIHTICERHHRSLSHRLCCAVLSEMEAQQKFDTSEAVWYASETADRHLRCGAQITYKYGCPTCTSHTEDWSFPTKTLETNVLRCCRQIYLEAKLVPYYANTFSFGSAISLSKFCRLVPEGCRSVIRNLHVDLQIFLDEYYTTQDWLMAFESVTASLKALQRLFITIELLPRQGFLRPEYLPGVERSWMSHFLQAGKLNLKVATVVLFDSHFTHDWSDYEIETRETRERWTLAQKQEWSRYLRNALLHYENRNSDSALLKQEAMEQGRICRL